MEEFVLIGKYSFSV